jgi:hypothetical protein
VPSRTNDTVEEQEGGRAVQKGGVMGHGKECYYLCALLPSVLEFNISNLPSDPRTHQMLQLPIIIHATETRLKDVIRQQYVQNILNFKRGRDVTRKQRESF